MALLKVAPLLALALGVGVASTSPAFGFDPKLHAEYTAAAFTLYEKHCQPAPPAKAGESIVKGVKAEDGPTLTRITNWHNNNRDRLVRRTSGVVKRNLDAVFRRRICRLEKRLKRTESKPAGIYKAAGRVLHYIQDMSVPAHVVPIYHGPGRKDRFDGYPPGGGDTLRKDVRDVLALELEKRGCEWLRPDHPEGSSSDFFQKLLDDTAQTTLRAIGQSKDADPGSERWLKFWDSAREPNGFAKYGPCLFQTGINSKACGGVDDAALNHFYQDRYRRTLEDTLRVLLYLEGRVARQSAR